MPRVNTKKTAQNWSLWAGSVSEEVKLPKVHLLAVGVYVALMIAFAVTAIIDYVNYEPPTLFSSLEAGGFGAVALNYSIDCRDCRRFMGQLPDGALWKLSWDYTNLAGGCAGAGKQPTAFNDNLRAFCQAQNNATTPRRYRLIPFANCANGFDYVIFPALTWRPTRQQCEAHCDAVPGCKAYGYALDTVRTPAGNLPAGSCLPINAKTFDPVVGFPPTGGCRQWGDPLDMAAAPVIIAIAYEPPAGAAPADPLDRCTITSHDVEMLTQSPSPDPLALTTGGYYPGFGWNPNYIGTRPTQWHEYGNTSAPVHVASGPDDYRAITYMSAPFNFGPVDPERGFGSYFKLKYAVPLCYVGDGEVAPMTLQFANIPHHAFHDVKGFGHARVTVSSGWSFSETNMFQSWHKNTLHLGLTVNQDADDTITSAEPYFSNFQYDGRVTWGEDGMLESGLAKYQNYVAALLGRNYDGLSVREAIVFGTQLHEGVLTAQQIANLTRAEIDARMATSDGSVNDMFVNEFKWKYGGEARVPDGGGAYAGRRTQEADGQAAGGPRVREEVGVDGEVSRHDRRLDRRRLSNHDEWGGVELSLRLSRFANVYTLGKKQTFQDVIATIGGASGSLIGLIGLAIAAWEVVLLLHGKFCKPKAPAPTSTKPSMELTSTMPGAEPDTAKA